MSDLLGRAYQVAKGYLDSARGRLEEIDARAQEELRRSLPRESPDAAPPAPNPGGAGADDPFARAASKIAAAQERVTAQRQETERRERATTTSEPTLDPVRTAYKIIGVPVGTDYLTAESAVNKLRERCSPHPLPRRLRRTGRCAGDLAAR